MPKENCCQKLWKLYCNTAMIDVNLVKYVKIIPAALTMIYNTIDWRRVFMQLCNVTINRVYALRIYAIRLCYALMEFHYKGGFREIAVFKFCFCSARSVTWVWYDNVSGFSLVILLLLES